jgi:hypothetical protein
MGWHRTPRTINEELQAQSARETALENDDRQEAKKRFGRLAVYLVAGLVLIGLKEGVRLLPPWVGIIVGVVVVAHFVSIFVRSTRSGSADRGRALRTLFVLWLAICLVATALVALGGFQMEERALLGVIWPVLGLIWVAYRLRRGGAPSPGPETGSESHP